VRRSVVGVMKELTCVEVDGLLVSVRLTPKFELIFLRNNKNGSVTY
jgi:hypothetical protein